MEDAVKIFDGFENAREGVNIAVCPRAKYLSPMGPPVDLVQLFNQRRAAHDPQIHLYDDPEDDADVFEADDVTEEEKEIEIEDSD